jgi:hypothetical protein
MCRPFSCIITKNQTVYSHPDPLIHSHTEIMKYFNLKESNKDPRFNSFVKIEAYPKDNKSLLTTSIYEWDIIVDEYVVPLWYEDDRESYEAIIRKESQSWLNRLKDIDWNKKTPGECYCYASYILKKPFPLGEKAIAEDDHYSYLYAKYVLKGPFTLGEASIAKNGYYSYLYAADILKGPFPLGEKNIATESADYSFNYANYVLNARFTLGESIIKNSMYQISYESTFNVKL